jgi:hypothetical protein
LVFAVKTLAWEVFDILASLGALALLVSGEGSLAGLGSHEDLCNLYCFFLSKYKHEFKQCCFSATTAELGYF